jgi:hypothetical protein
VATLRNILGVVVGYLIFAVSAVMLFAFSGIDPHANAGLGTIAIVVLFGAVFSFAGGFVAKLTAADGTIKVNFVLALIMAGFAAFSLIKSPGNHYTQIAAIVVFAPLSIGGGLVRRRSRS